MCPLSVIQKIAYQPIGCTFVLLCMVDLITLAIPFRLGVGMTVPDTAGPSGRETAQLKNKLTGKKRPRDEDKGSHGLVMNGTTKGRKKDEESDEEESRVGAIRKRAKVDPFEKKGKKKKGKENKRDDTVNGKEEDFGKINGKVKEWEGKSVVAMFEVPSFGSTSGSGIVGDKVDVGADGDSVRQDGSKEATVKVNGVAEGTLEGKRKRKKRKKNRMGEDGCERQDAKDISAAVTQSSNSVVDTAKSLKEEKSGLSISIGFVHTG